MLNSLKKSRTVSRTQEIAFTNVGRFPECGKWQKISELNYC